MPNKQTHQKITTLSAILLLPTVMLVHPSDFVAMEIGHLLTLFPALTPDLDINTRKFGSLGAFFGFKMYAKNVPHRAGLRKGHWQKVRELLKRNSHERIGIAQVFFFSHIPFIGTFPRLTMALLPLLLAALLFPGLLLTPQIGRFVLWIWLGMSISDTWHVLADQPWKQEQPDTRRQRYRMKFGKEKDVLKRYKVRLPRISKKKVKVIDETGELW